MEPDGSKRVVEYSDDGYGFNAVVKKDGYSASPYKPAYSSYPVPAYPAPAYPTQAYPPSYSPSPVYKPAYKPY